LILSLWTFAPFNTAGTDKEANTTRRSLNDFVIRLASRNKLYNVAVMHCKHLQPHPKKNGQVYFNDGLKFLSSLQSQLASDIAYLRVNTTE